MVRWLVTVLRSAAYAASGLFSVPWLSISRLRGRGLHILAYHEVPDGDLFEAQMAFVSRNFFSVGLDQVREGIESRGKRNCVWVTFDDGYDSVSRTAMDILNRFEVRATAFICPGMLTGNRPYWWETVEYASSVSLRTETGTVVHSDVARLKSVPDQERRALVFEIESALAREGRQVPIRPRMTNDAIEEWIEFGHSVGNHSWDHPLLDFCDEEEQGRQINLSHEWLESVMPDGPWAFAYPNGNWSAASEAILSRLGYDIGVAFDHKVERNSPRLAMSRLRVNADSPISEFKSKASGLHSWLRSSS